MFMGRISIAEIHTWSTFVVSEEEPSRTFFLSSPTDETCNVDHLNHLLLVRLVSVFGQGPRPNTLFPKAQYIILGPNPYIFLY